MSEVSVEIVDVNENPLLFYRMSWPVVDGRVLLEFSDGNAELNVYDIMLEQFSEFDLHEMATVALTVTIDDDEFQLSVTREIYLEWGMGR